MVVLVQLFLAPYQMTRITGQGTWKSIPHPMAHPNPLRIVWYTRLELAASTSTSTSTSTILLRKACTASREGSVYQG